MENKENDIVKIRYMNADNTVFKINGDFLAVNYDDNGEHIYLPRVILSRMFPFSSPYSDISVQDENRREIGMISSLTEFDPDTAKMLAKELDLMYFVPQITKITYLKERFNYSVWKVKTNVGDMSFTVHDTFASIVKKGENCLIISDVDTNRYEIPDVNALDRHSRAKLELYI